MTSPALQQATAVGAVDGPLAGYHREWYVVRPEGELTRLGRVKIGEPRQGALWFDRRYFASEDELLLELARLGVPRVPPVHRVHSTGTVFHGFIEGRTLAALSPCGRPVAPVHLRQIMERFASLSRLRPGDVRARRLTVGERGGERDSAGFPRVLLDFTRERAYRARLPRFGPLFARLGIPPDALGPGSRLAAEAARMSARPVCLLHGDLHRANFIVDHADALWTIDWELASFGDPLYDLATHLYLMGYPASQQARVVEEWQRTVAPLLPGADARLAEDLPRYLDYKRAQSVFTDVVRQAVAVADAVDSPAFAGQLGQSAKLVHDVLVRAAEPLELSDVPSPGAVELAYADFCAGSDLRAASTDRRSGPDSR
ncbi:aminoglycoside phosphotransferase family protein [Streptomyces spirodelae]|uniref:Aminoglycoside phosphotransferase family protein n=1 Tax=Streptomyces spirodelae TaxID=2812904 RepID=A0ABS3WYU3_9ACTN|nr:aminoglycoside phosphotransferase family protein [Streptomyces spirodelae]MBO8187987.1 aminoglycoside phosphotransferase family protein [Streptomyces spirodelae]